MKQYRSIRPPTPALADAVRAGLERANYTADAVLDAIGQAGQADLARNHSWAAAVVLDGRRDALATLIRLFILQRPQPVSAVAAAGLTGLIEAGLLAEVPGGVDWVGASRANGVGAAGGGGAAGPGAGDPDDASGQVRALVDLRPYADEVAGVAGWVVSDHTATLDTAGRRPRPDHVLGISPASVSLSQITPAHRVGRALDLGTGSGVQCLRLSAQADQVVATDLNPRALALANWTFALNGLTVDARLGSLYQPVADQRFDLITTNPPFVIAPPQARRLLYRETELPGDDLMRLVVSQAGDRLNPGGSLHVVGNWAHLAGQPWSDRLTGWLPPGCDAIAVQREQLDPYEYIEVWLADAGLAGRPDYQVRYEQWLAYFKHLGIEAVGLGWITLVKSASAVSRLTDVDWPGPVTQPVADDLMAHLAGLDLAELPDDALLDQHWRLAAGTIQQTVGPAGSADPSQVSLRRVDGLCRAIAVDPGLGGVLGACDGELSLRQIIAAVAELLAVDPAGLTARLVPQIRQLITTTWLTPAKSV